MDYNLYLVALVFLVVLATSTASRIEQLTGNADYLQTCINRICISNEQVENFYKGVFFTEKDIVQLQTTIDSRRQERLNRFGIHSSQSIIHETPEVDNSGSETLYKITDFVGDGDACCSTNTMFYLNVTMRNIQEAMRTLVHLGHLNPPKYQLIPHGTCGDYGICLGVCFQEMMYLSLLVYDDNATSYPPLTFDVFEIPGYCSCKNVTC